MSENGRKTGYYNSDKIEVLTIVEAVQLRAKMYIGDTDDGSGLHNMIYSIVDNSIDESLAGHADRIDVTLHPDGSCSVRDNGRGIPISQPSGYKISIAEATLTRFAGGNFVRCPDTGTLCLKGISISVVNALSVFLQLTIWRDGKEHHMEFSNGESLDPLKIVGDAPQEKHRDEEERPRSGTLIRFSPSKDVFSTVEFNRNFIAGTLEKFATDNPDITFSFRDERQAELFSKTYN